MVETHEELQFLAQEEVEEFKPILTEFLDKNYGKPYTLEYRIKSPEKIRLKQELFSKMKGIDFPLWALPDIIGYRIGVESEEEVEVLNQLIKMEYEPIRIMDYFNNPKESGFRAYLQQFDNARVNTEIQIMTFDMIKWTNATHQDYDDKKYVSLK
ncbi:MAG: hypothetical protein J1F35_04660 [Erysipelotrichales bacterium]|nr:hypothetical protein [Erysipelotrichales bacterium]